MEQIVLVLGITVLAVALFKYLKLPSIIAYLLIGCILGPYAIGVLHNTEYIKWLAEIGVVFLLFTIGLELPLAKFMEMRYDLLIIGCGQVFFCTLLFMILMCGFGVNFLSSLVAASALSLSSTAIIMRQLSEQNDLFSRHGQLVFAMLIFQDIAVVPLLILLPILASFNQPNAEIAANYELILPIITIMFKGCVVFAIIIGLSKTVLRKLFHKIAMTRSLELFMFAVLFVALLAAYVTHEFGLSMSFGAFVAGIGLGESEYRHQIDSEIRPFRDILLGIFFISIGMLLNLEIVFNNFTMVLVAVLAIVLIKFIVVTLLCYLLGRKVNMLTCLKSGMILAHAGEFGLAILTLAGSYKLIYGNTAQIILAAMIISLFIAVLMTKYSGFIINFIAEKTGIKQFRLLDNQNNMSVENEHCAPIAAHYPHMSDHIIICGFGRVGKNLARLLKMNNLHYLCLETNSRLVRNGVTSDYNVYFGDCATSRDILALASLNQAKMVVICVDNDHVTKNIIKNIRSLHSKIPILVRTRDLNNSKDLQDAGANEVISETEEASFMLALNMLIMLGTSTEKAIDTINEIRHKKVDFFENLLRERNLLNK